MGAAQERPALEVLHGMLFSLGGEKVKILRDRRGFTLVEMLIVITIIGV